MVIITGRATSDYTTVTVASQQFANMVAGMSYRIVSSVDAWVAIGSNPTAAAADNSHYLAAGRELIVRALAADDNVAILRVGSSDGVATMTIVGV